MLLDRAWIPTQEEVMRVNISVIVLPIEIIKYLRILVLLVSLLLLPNFTHYVFLQTSGKVIRVTEVKALINLHLLEVVHVSVLIVSVLGRGVGVEGYELHIFDRVD